MKMNESQERPNSVNSKHTCALLHVRSSAIPTSPTHTKADGFKLKYYFLCFVINILMFRLLVDTTVY